MVKIILIKINILYLECFSTSEGCLKKILFEQSL